MTPRWQEAGDRFLLTGFPGVEAFTSNRLLDMPPGEYTAADLREWIGRSGVTIPAAVGMRQVHGCRVEKISDTTDRVVPSCDGVWTDRPGVVLAARSADCLPVIFFAPLRDFLGVAHAGWKGIRAGILTEMVRALATPQLMVAIGPGIGPCCYQVGPEFEGYFPGFLRLREGKRFFDLPGAARAQLLQAGVQETAITPAPWCSCCHPSCHSFRRDGAAARRMVTLARLRS